LVLAKELKMKLQLALVLLLGVSCFAAKSRYDNYKLYSFMLSNEEQVKHVAELERSSDSLDFWSGPSLARNVSVVVAPHKLGEFEDFLDRFNIPFEIQVENLQELVDAQDPELLSRNTPEPRNFAWDRFYTPAEMTTWLDGLVQRCGPLTVTTIGTSFEGRPIRAFHYTERANNPAIFIEANIHAREWASSATATWLLNELCTNTGNAAIRNLALTVDWYIIPVANPDGHQFSHSTTRLWRKTRQPHGTCIGADPNRNFDFFWNGGGSSTNPCSDTFHGPNPFSEPETAAIRTFYGSIASQTRIFLSFHAFGQYLLMPFGHTTANSNNHANLLSVAQATATAIRNTAGADYLFGSTASVLYTASGSSPDWAFGVHNTRLAYTFEFRPIRNTSNGFLLAPAQIIPNNVEVVNGIVAMVARARELGHM